MPAKVYQYGITRMPDRLPEPVFEQAIVAASDADLAMATERIAAMEAELEEAQAEAEQLDVLRGK